MRDTWRRDSICETWTLEGHRRRARVPAQRPEHVAVDSEADVPAAVLTAEAVPKGIEDIECVLAWRSYTQEGRDVSE